MLLFCYGSIFQELSEERSQQLNRRTTRLSFLRISWSIFAMIMVMSYTGNLKASLASRSYEMPVETLDQMVDTDLPIYADEGIYALMDSARETLPIYDRLASQVQVIDQFYYFTITVRFSVVHAYVLYFLWFKIVSTNVKKQPT